MRQVQFELSHRHARYVRGILGQHQTDAPIGQGSTYVATFPPK